MRPHSAAHTMSMMMLYGSAETLSRPRIGVTAATGAFPQRFVDAVYDAGGNPIVLANDPRHVEVDIELLDGILFTGGGDVDPFHYGEVRHPLTEGIMPDRDDYEIALARSTFEYDVAVLAICRGIQVLNVALGGSLVQHVPEKAGAMIEHRVASSLSPVEGHDVAIDPQSKLGTILDTPVVTTTSDHHQACARISDALRVVAVTPDGIVEALEGRYPRRFFIGVQWHPERMFAHGDSSIRLFRAFIEASAATVGRQKKVNDTR